MKINWKIKSTIFKFIDKFNATYLLYFAQKYITKRSKKTNTSVSSRMKNYHLNNSELHKQFILDNNIKGSLFEFGAGKNLFQNIFLSDCVDKQVIVDINDMIDIELVNESISIVNQLNQDSTGKSKVKNFRDLQNYFNITYLAPYDASKTNFKDNYFDVCISTNTLEHIPCESIILILKELKRVIKKNGMISAIIDYSDHYAHTDPAIGLLNFLNYSSDDWKKYNHESHYQNRLRHYEYIDIFNSSGFEIIDELINYEEKNISDKLMKKYIGFPRSWAATSAHIVMRAS